MSTFLHCDWKQYLFQKAETFLHKVISWHFFFEIHNPNKKWLEISIFKNLIIRWVYKVVTETLKKSGKIHEVFVWVIVTTHDVVAKSKRVRYKRLSIIGEITYMYKSYETLRFCIFIHCAIRFCSKKIHLLHESFLSPSRTKANKIAKILMKTYDELYRTINSFLVFSWCH